MNYIYYCTNCNFVGNGEVVNGKVLCPKCHRRLAFTGMTQAEWNQLSDIEKINQMREWKKTVRTENHIVNS